MNSLYSKASENQLKKEANSIKTSVTLGSVTPFGYCHRGRWYDFRTWVRIRNLHLATGQRFEIPESLPLAKDIYFNMSRMELETPNGFYKSFKVEQIGGYPEMWKAEITPGGGFAIIGTEEKQYNALNYEAYIYFNKKKEEV